MKNGLWIVLEGCDGVGKTTAMDLVTTKMRARFGDQPFVRTRHPGMTGLGNEIRNLVLHRGTEEHVIIDPMSEQLLLLVDYISFKNELLWGTLAKGEHVFSDRCNLISGMVYGMANGLTWSDIERFIAIAQMPTIDRLYVLSCDWNSIVTRLHAKQGGKDRFESRGPGFLQHVADLYTKLLTSPKDLTVLLNKLVALENVKYIDADQPAEAVADAIIEDLAKSVLWQRP